VLTGGVPGPVPRRLTSVPPQPPITGGASDARLNPMSKSNVNPNHYKVAGRERQGEDILQQRHKQKLGESLARERFEPRLPNPAYTGPGRDEFGPEAPARSFQESSVKQVPPTNLTARKKPAAAARSKAKAAARHAAKPGAKKRAPAPTTRRAPIKAQASAKAEKRATAQKRTSSRNDVESRPEARATAGARRKKPSTGRRGKR
jgi:hypothetical protein